MIFFMPMNPPTTTAQEHKVTIRNGKPCFYDPPEVKEAKAKLTNALIEHIPDKPFTKAVKLSVSWQFKADTKHPHGTYRDTKPDTDNLQKMLKDCMTALKYWKDDCLVVEEHVEKVYRDIPGILIAIEEKKCQTREQ